MKGRCCCVRKLRGQARPMRIAEENLTSWRSSSAERHGYNGYDLTMEITGTPEAPSIVFTSSPALDSDQLLMMVMTGAVRTTDSAIPARSGLRASRHLPRPEPAGAASGWTRPAPIA